MSRCSDTLAVLKRHARRRDQAQNGLLSEGVFVRRRNLIRTLHPIRIPLRQDDYQFRPLPCDRAHSITPLSRRVQDGQTVGKSRRDLFCEKAPSSRVAHHFHIPPTMPEEKPVLGKKFRAGRTGQPVGLRRWRRDGCQERGKHDGADIMTCAFLQRFSSLCV